MTELMKPYTDDHGTTWYPVSHALGGIVCSFTEDSQRRWQELADKQRAALETMFAKKSSSRNTDHPA